MGLRTTRTLVDTHSGLQRIRIVQTPLLGRVLILDDAFQCSERDEALYHVPLVHGALMRAARPARVLVIGGGDGGAARRVLQDRRVRSLVHVEIDAQVVRACARHLRAVHAGVLDPGRQDPRYELRIGDGLRYVRALPRACIDCLVLDLTDPDPNSALLHGLAFHRRCARVLAPGGTIAMHVGHPFETSTATRLRRLRTVFAEVSVLVVPVVSYGGLWTLAVCAEPRGADDAAVRVSQRSGIVDAAERSRAREDVRMAAALARSLGVAHTEGHAAARTMR